MKIDLKELKKKCQHFYIRHLLKICQLYYLVLLKKCEGKLKCLIWLLSKVIIKIKDHN